MAGRSKESNKLRNDARRKAKKENNDKRRRTPSDANLLDDDGLNAKQALFVKRYLVHHVGARAAREAGYSVLSSGTIAQRLLNQTEAIQAVIKREEARTAIKLEVSKENVLRRLAQIAFANSKDLYDENSVPLPIQDIDDDTAALLGGFEVNELYAGMGQERQNIGVVKKYKLRDPTKALDMLSKHLGLYEGSDGLKKDRLREIVDALRGGPLPPEESK